jgi:hypothetical protein
MSQKQGITSTKALAIVVIAIVIVGVGIGAYFLISAPPPAPTKTSILVGWTESDTGPLSTLLLYDTYYRWIIEDYNKTGGLYLPEYGKTLPFATPKVYDDHSDLSIMIQDYEKLITVDHVDLLFTPISTAMNYALFPLCQEYKMPIVALTFGSDAAGGQMKSGVYSYAFSVLGFPSETADQVVSLFKYINSTVDPGKLMSVGILYDTDQHGTEYGLAMDAALVKNNFTVPVFTGFPEWPSGGPAAFAPMISALNASKVDVAILSGYEGGLFEAECGILNYHPSLIVCGPGMETPIWMSNVWLLPPAWYNGTMLYDGWPSTAYKTTDLSAWAKSHYDRSITEPFGINPAWGGSWPFPASATFYAGLQCQFLAVIEHGLNGTAIRDALATENFTTILGNTHLRQGASMECSLAGTICQWQGGNMSEVIWPLSAKSANIVYPSPPGSA